MFDTPEKDNNPVLRTAKQFGFILRKKSKEVQIQC